MNDRPPPDWQGSAGGNTMPIYEFYCHRCNTLFNFFSKTINTKKTPNCPTCGTDSLNRQVSLFAHTGRAKEPGEDDDLPFDESKMEKAVEMLSREADRIDEDNPRQAADLMRRLSDMTGLRLGEGMNEALSRMERGEDPEQIEAEMGDLLESEDPFELPAKPAAGGRSARPAPRRDDKLYEL
jgi:putative FmdB family regulatory protein